jgi:hypothetical protein
MTVVSLKPDNDPSFELAIVIILYFIGILADVLDTELSNKISIISFICATVILLNAILKK